MDTTLEYIRSEERPEEIRQWFVECPLEEGLAEADIAVRPIPYGMFSVILWEIKNCSFWPKRAGCDQKCIRKIQRDTALD